jgi:hypothetical protein
MIQDFLCEKWLKRLGIEVSWTKEKDIGLNFMDAKNEG